MQRVKIILHEADSTKQNMQYVKLFYTDRWWTLVTAFLNVFLYFPRFVTFLKTVLVFTFTVQFMCRERSLDSDDEGGRRHRTSKRVTERTVIYGREADFSAVRRARRQGIHNNIAHSAQVRPMPSPSIRRQSADPVPWIGIHAAIVIATPAEPLAAKTTHRTVYSLDNK